MWSSSSSLIWLSDKDVPVVSNSKEGRVWISLLLFMVKDDTVVVEVLVVDLLGCGSSSSCCCCDCGEVNPTNLGQAAFRSASLFVVVR